jgi:hypothetical protein
MLARRRAQVAIIGLTNRTTQGFLAGDPKKPCDQVRATSTTVSSPASDQTSPSSTRRNGPVRVDGRTSRRSKRPAKGVSRPFGFQNHRRLTFRRIQRGRDGARRRDVVLARAESIAHRLCAEHEDDFDAARNSRLGQCSRTTLDRAFGGVSNAASVVLPGSGR